MKCPLCNNKIEQVNIISDCWQKADVDKDRNIVDYGSIEEILGTKRIECPKCSSDITKYVKEN